MCERKKMLNVIILIYLMCANVDTTTVNVTKAKKECVRECLRNYWSIQAQLKANIDPNPYFILTGDSVASVEIHTIKQLQKLRRGLLDKSKKCHPDKFVGMSTTVVEALHSNMIHINMAFERIRQDILSLKNDTVSKRSLSSVVVVDPHGKSGTSKEIRLRQPWIIDDVFQRDMESFFNKLHWRDRIITGIALVTLVMLICYKPSRTWIKWIIVTTMTFTIIAKGKYLYSILFVILCWKGGVIVKGVRTICKYSCCCWIFL